MNARLYVGNLAEDASTEALRRRFAQHGAVTDVHMAVDRSSGRARGYAFVTMATGEDARAAVDRLDGAMFEQRPLRVNPAASEGDERQPARAAAARVRMTLQFRERQNMAYELDCRGTALTVRVFPVEGAIELGEQWRVEASIVGPTKLHMASGTCSTRALALKEIATAWEQQEDGFQPDIDWAEVIAAMAAVRAV